MVNISKSEYKRCISAEICNHKMTNPILIRKNILFNKSKEAIYLIRRFQKSSNKFIRAYYRNKLIKFFGIFIGENTRIGCGLVLGHPCCIVFGDDTVIGDNCTVYHNVTFGKKILYDTGSNCYPIIGNKCVLYAGVTVIGPVKVADKTVIGANSVLTKDTRSGAVYAGSPAFEILSHHDSEKVDK